MRPHRPFVSLLASSLIAPALLVGLATGTASAATADPYDVVMFDFGPSGGSQRALSSPDWSTRVTVNGSALVIRAASTATGTFGQGSVTMTPPTDAVDFVPGTTYPIARTAGAGVAGLDARISIGGCVSGATGHLTIHELTRAGDGSVTNLAASYDQTCTGGTLALFGEIRKASTRDYRHAFTDVGLLSYYSAVVGATSAPRTVTVTAGGTTALTTGAATIDGPNAADFAVSSDGCAAATLNPAATCAVAVTTNPSATGNRTATLHIPTDTLRGELTIPLSASAITTPGAPQNPSADSATDGIALSWDYPATNGNATVTGFDLYRGTAADALSPYASGLSTLNFADPVSATTTAGTTYFYAVRAVNAAGAGPLSATLSATTPATPYDGGPVRAFTVDGPIGSLLVNGDSITWTDTDTRDVFLVGTRKYATLSASSTIVGGVSQSSSIDLRPETGGLLAVGHHETTRSADSTHYGMSVGYGSLGCNTSTGSVDIADVKVSSDGKLAVLDADYTFYCDGSTIPVTGAIRWHSSRAFDGVEYDLPSDVHTSRGVSSAVTVVMHNTGSTTITVDPASIAAATGYGSTPVSEWVVDTATSTCPGLALAPGSSCTFVLGVTPTATGVRTVVLSAGDSTGVHSHARLVTVASYAPPTAPINLAATRDGAGIHLTWAPTGSDYYTYATAGRVYRGSSPTALVEVGTVTASNLSAWVDPDVSTGTRYYAVVLANSAGDSPQSTPLQAVVGMGAPTAVTAVSLARKVGLRWQPPRTLAPAAPVGYQVFWGRTSTSLTAVSANGLSRLIGGLTAGTRVYYQLRTVYPGSQYGPKTALLSVVAGSAELDVVTADDELVAMPISGGVGVPLSTNLYNYTSPVTSRDGRWIAFSAGGGPTTNNDIYVISVDGTSAARRLFSTTGSDDTDPTWSADGKTIAFGAYNPSTDVETLGAAPFAGGTPRTLPGSTDLSTPSYLGTTGLLVASDDSAMGDGLMRLSPTGARTALTHDFGIEPSASFDGKRIAYVVPLFSGSSFVGTAVKVLTIGSSAVAMPGQYGKLWSTPAWSLDGTTVAGGLLDLNTGAADVYRITVATKAVAQLTHDGASGPVTQTRPDVTAPTVRLTAPTTTSTTATSVKVAWAASDAQAGVLSSDVRYRRALGSGALGAYSSPSGWTGTTASYKTLTVAKGYRYCFSVRTRDRAGNLSGWTAERCVTRR